MCTYIYSLCIAHTHTNTEPERLHRGGSFLRESNDARDRKGKERRAHNGRREKEVDDEKEERRNGEGQQAGPSLTDSANVGVGCNATQCSVYIRRSP